MYEPPLVLVVWIAIDVPYMPTPGMAMDVGRKMMIMKPVARTIPHQTLQCTHHAHLNDL